MLGKPGGYRDDILRQSIAFHVLEIARGWIYHGHIRGQKLIYITAFSELMREIVTSEVQDVPFS